MDDVGTTDDRVLHQVRVPVVFDHLNGELREQVLQREVALKQRLGRGAEVVDEEGLRIGKFEVWFEVRRPPTREGCQDAADSAIRLVEDALTDIGLAPTPDERGLSVVHNQVITTPFAGSEGP